MTEDEKKTREDNKERVLLALGLLLMGKTSEEDLVKIEKFEDLPSEIKEDTLKKFEEKNLQKLTDKDEPLSKEDTLKIAAETSDGDYFQIISVGDDRVCEHCRKWQNKIVSMSGNDPRYKRLDDFLNSDGAHFGCRCYLQPYTPKKPTTKDLNTMAMNAESLKDTTVYRGFIDEEYDPDIDYDYSEETLVMLTPLGEFVGSSTDGKPLKEIVDEESIKLMAMQTEEILLDKDHASMRPVGERNTEAMGWISGLKAVTNLGSLSGLFGIIKWSGEGMRLAKDRVYRFLSPVFELDQNGRAVKLLNVALTNRPALKMPPIINSEADTNDISITSTQKDYHMDINKDELVELIKTMVTAMNSEPVEEKKEETVETSVENACGEDTEKKVEVENEDTKSTESDVKTETPVAEASESEKKPEDDVVTKEEVKNEDKVESEADKVIKDIETPITTEKKEEVIKEEALNSAPTIGADISGKAEWINLRGKAFFQYLKDHPEVYNSCR